MGSKLKVFVANEIAMIASRIALSIARIVYPHGGVRRVLRGHLRGLRFEVSNGMGITYALGFAAYKFDSFRPYIRSGDTVLDVGTNSGQMLLAFATWVGPTGRVIGLEPIEELCSRAVRTIQLNRMSQAKVLCAAASSCAGTTVFEFNADHPTQGKVASAENTYRVAGATSREVRTVRLDSVVPLERRISLVKIDVEGGAAGVLAGMDALWGRIDRIYIELHGPEEQAAVRDLIVPRGFDLFTLDGQRVGDPTAAWFSPLWCVARG